MMYVVILIFIIYITLIIALIIGLDKVDTFKNNYNIAKNTFSIVIPFRNEEHHLADLLRSLGTISYPPELFEIMLVNDDSQDSFQSIVDHFTAKNPELNFTLTDSIRNTNSPKKDAINTAVKFSKFDWIVTTDADCEVPINWLLLFNQIIEEKQGLLIGAPVKFKEEKSLLYHFQNLHFIGLMGSTIGGFGLKRPFMCNGANLCYHKETFVKLNGFEGNASIASGDDIFLLEKMQRTYPDKINFLKSTDAVVETKSAYSWRLFSNQQIRWVSKSTAYKNSFIKIVGIIVFSTNSILTILAVFAILFSHFWKYFLILLILKSVVDFILIFKTSYFLKTSKSLRYFLGIILVYPFFIVSIGVSSLFKDYTWKGRSFKK